MQVWASFFLANAVVREDQPQPLVVRAPENQCVQLQPMWEPIPARGLPKPLLLRGLLCVPSGCTVRACSPSHAHSAHHFSVVFH